MNAAEYRGQNPASKVWHYGCLISTIHGCYIIHPDDCFPPPIIKQSFIRVDPDSIGKFIGIKDQVRNRFVYEGDVYFSEDEGELGDLRTFFVVTWISDWSMFMLLTYGEWAAYTPGSVRTLEGIEPTHIDEREINSVHFFGTIYERENEIN